MSAERYLAGAGFVRGCSLFNGGRFFEAHEAWEEMWRGAEGPGRKLLQGLIQIAAGFHKGIAERKAEGCVRLLEAGLWKLDSGWLPDFQEGVQRSLAEARRWQRGETAGLDSANVPRLALESGVESE